MDNFADHLPHFYSPLPTYFSMKHAFVFLFLFCFVLFFFFWGGVGGITPPSYIFLPWSKLSNPRSPCFFFFQTPAPTVLRFVSILPPPSKNQKWNSPNKVQNSSSMLKQIRIYHSHKTGKKFDYRFIWISCCQATAFWGDIIMGDIFHYILWALSGF